MNIQRPNQIFEYYIAYFDVLGYQEFFKETPEKAQEFLNAINSAINKVLGSIQSFNESLLVSQFADSHIRSKIFSDNIFLCMETGRDILKEKLRLLLFMSVVSEIQRKFIMEYGLFLRGGLTIGTLSFNNDYIFGEGVIEAAEMEKSTVYPRIAVSEKVISFLEKIQLYSQEEADKAMSIENRSKSGEQISEDDSAFYQKMLYLVRQESFAYNICMNLLCKCADDVWCLSYLYCMDIRSYIPPEITLDMIKEFMKRILPEAYEELPEMFPNIDFILETHKSIIEKRLIKYSDYSQFSTYDIKKFESRERILKKYVWSMVYHNYMCERYNKAEYGIRSAGNCERRHMKLVIHVYDKNGNILSANR